MNKDRIEELAFDAMLNSIFEPREPFISRGGTDPYKVEVPLVFVHKLAESIIRDCAKVADANYNKGFRPVGLDILEHFGVELPTLHKNEEL